MEGFYYSSALEESVLTRGNVTSLQWQLPGCGDVDALHPSYDAPQSSTDLYPRPTIPFESLESPYEVTSLQWQQRICRYAVYNDLPPPSPSTTLEPTAFIPLGQLRPRESLWLTPERSLHGPTDLSNLRMPFHNSPSTWTASEASTPSPTRPWYTPPAADKRRTPYLRNRDRFHPYVKRSHDNIRKELNEAPLNVGHEHEDVAENSSQMEQDLKEALRRRASANCSHRRRLEKRDEVDRLRAVLKIKVSENEVLRRAADGLEAKNTNKSSETEDLCIRWIRAALEENVSENEAIRQVVDFVKAEKAKRSERVASWAFNV